MIKLIMAGTIITFLVWFSLSEDRILNLVEQDLTAVVDEQLTSIDRQNVDVFVAGRDVVVQVHQYENYGELESLRARLAGVSGVSRVFLTGSSLNDSEIAMAAAALSGTNSKEVFAEIRKTGNQITVTGVADSLSETRVILDRLANEQGTKIYNYLEPANSNRVSDWIKVLSAYADSFPLVADNAVAVSDKGVSVYADEDNEQVRLERSIMERALNTRIRGQDRVYAIEELVAVNAGNVGSNGSQTEAEVREAPLVAEPVEPVALVERESEPVAIQSSDVQSSVATADDSDEVVDSYTQSVTWSENVDADISTGIDVCNAELSEIVGDKQLAFKHMSEDIDEETIGILNEVSQLVNRCDGMMLVVNAHTDNLGAADFNLRLSQRRADVIAAEIVRNGVDSNNINSIGHGEDTPIATNDTVVGRWKNRRIELEFQGISQ